MYRLYPKTISLLGSTGSIGTQCLAVCKNLNYKVAALTAYNNEERLAAQARQWNPELVVIGDPNRYASLKTLLADTNIRIAAGQEAICQATTLDSCDTVVNAVVGISGLRPTLAAVAAGKNLALANKESLVAGGKLVMDLAKAKGVSITPVDSEHSAMLQCMHPSRRHEVRGVILTASGGPFFGKTPEDLREITAQQALCHPNWKMGPKITIDCATLMNKGLEFIEAMWLFDLQPDQIEVVVHHQSIIHSAVEYNDGSVIAQMGVPDMGVAIQYALTFPAHLPLDTKRLSLPQLGKLTFAAPDLDTFRCLRVCMEVARSHQLAACVANGANEAAVALFLQDKIPFLHIGELVEAAVAQVAVGGEITLDSIEAADMAARHYVTLAAGL